MFEIHSGQSYRPCLAVREVIAFGGYLVSKNLQCSLTFPKPEHAQRWSRLSCRRNLLLASWLLFHSPPLQALFGTNDFLTRQLEVSTWKAHSSSLRTWFSLKCTTFFNNFFFLLKLTKFSISGDIAGLFPV